MISDDAAQDLLSNMDRHTAFAFVGGLVLSGVDIGWGASLAVVLGFHLLKPEIRANAPALFRPEEAERPDHLYLDGGAFVLGKVLGKALK